MRTTYAAGLAALLALTACGNEPSERDVEVHSAPPTAVPTKVPASDGKVTTQYPVTVIDDGNGAELCVGGVDDSLPPQCGGPQLLGWDWNELDGDFEEQSGTRWGDFVVTGTFDGASLTVSSVVPASQADPRPDADEDVWNTPCPEPEGGWVPVDPDTTTQAGVDRAFRIADRLPTYGGSWVDLSINPAADEEPDGLEWELAMSDPRYTIINVAVTDDLDGAEAAIREVWGGPLCVSEALHTDRELRQIEDDLADLPGAIGAEASDEGIHAYVIHDDGTLQAWVDQEYGEGVVEVSSALMPADG
jgi:hypothetical protein